MKANELMIGDLLLHKGQPIKVEEILIDGINPMWDGSENYGNEAYYEDLQPIPLTPEILEKNGFERKRCDDIKLWSYSEQPYLITFLSDHGCPVLTIEDVEDSGLTHNLINLKDEVYNVHELQHALRLCGIEKEIIV